MYSLRAAIGNLGWTYVPIFTLWEDSRCRLSAHAHLGSAGDGTRPCTKDASALSTRLHACCGTSCLLPQDPRRNVSGMTPRSRCLLLSNSQVCQRKLFLLHLFTSQLIAWPSAEHDKSLVEASLFCYMCLWLFQDNELQDSLIRPNSAASSSLRLGMTALTQPSCSCTSEPSPCKR